MNIYLAAPWGEKDGAAKLAKEYLEAAGHTVTARWIVRESSYDDPPTSLRAEAINDIEDVLNCNMLVFLNCGPTQGAHIEVGLAIAMLKPVIIVGERTTVFHHLRCPRVDTIEEAVKELEQWIPATHKWPDVEETRGAIRK